MMEMFRCLLVFLCGVAALVVHTSVPPRATTTRIFSFQQHPAFVVPEEFTLELPDSGYKIKSTQAAAGSSISSKSSSDEKIIYLQDAASGWGTGAHPTTRLCLDFISHNTKKGDVVLDYGTGSGILSILAAKLGAETCVAVDIDEDSLRAVQANAQLNGYNEERIRVVHTKLVYLGCDLPQADVCVANILPGPLSRLVAIIWGFTKEGGKLCLSGMRPSELPAIRAMYLPFVDEETELVQQLGNDLVGDWVSWSARVKTMTEEQRKDARNRLSEAAMG